MEISRDSALFPQALKVVVCGGVPTEKQWNYKLAVSTYGEREWSSTLGVKEKGLRKILDRHRRPAQSNITVEQEGVPDELRCRWNSVEEIWREKRADLGPFVGGPVFTAECQIVFYWDLRLHNGRRSYPIPICFNPSLLIKQWNIYQSKTKPCIYERIANRRWKESPLIMPEPPDKDPDVRAEYLRFYGFDSSDHPGNSMILVTSTVVTLKTEYAKFQITTWDRAELISDPKQLYVLPRKSNAKTKINWGTEYLNNQMAKKVFQG